MPPAVAEPTNQFQANIKNPFHISIQSKAKALRLPDKNAAMGVDFFPPFDTFVLWNLAWRKQRA
jgi:hypothetical protein